MCALFKESEQLRSHEETSGYNVETDQPRRCKVDDTHQLRQESSVSLVKKRRTKCPGRSGYRGSGPYGVAASAQFSRPPHSYIRFA